jgi:hypothetical protein
MTRHIPRPSPAAWATMTGFGRAICPRGGLTLVNGTEKCSSFGTARPCLGWSDGPSSSARRQRMRTYGRCLRVARRQQRPRCLSASCQRAGSVWEARSLLPPEATTGAHSATVLASAGTTITSRDAGGTATYRYDTTTFSAQAYASARTVRAAHHTRRTHSPLTTRLDETKSSGLQHHERRRPRSANVNATVDSWVGGKTQKRRRP